MNCLEKPLENINDSTLRINLHGDRNVYIIDYLIVVHLGLEDLTRKFTTVTSQLTCPFHYAWNIFKADGFNYNKRLIILLKKFLW